MQSHQLQERTLPTASGKTVVFASLIKETEGKSLVLAHTNELLKQAREKIQMIAQNLSVGLINADSKEFDFLVIVSSIQSARQPNNLAELQAQNFNLLVYDECHHAASETSRNVLHSLGFGSKTDRLLCGFTATAFRQDGRGLGEVFDKVSYQRTIKEMIADGYLCPPKGVRVSTDIDLSKVKMGNEDFQAESLLRSCMFQKSAKLLLMPIRKKVRKGKQFASESISSMPIIFPVCLTAAEYHLILSMVECPKVKGKVY
jgi:ATP-dependent helicase IRC3